MREYALLLDQYSDYGIIYQDWPDPRWIVEATGLSRTTAQAAIDELNRQQEAQQEAEGDDA